MGGRWAVQFPSTFSVYTWNTVKNTSKSITNWTIAQYEVKDHLFCFISSKSFITCLWSLCVDVEMRVCLGLNHWSCYQDWAGAWPVATAPHIVMISLLSPVPTIRALDLARLLWAPAWLPWLVTGECWPGRHQLHTQLSSLNTGND